jgi:hypothetical protein
MPSLEQDKRFYREAAPQLEDYLLSKEIFWPLGGKLPQLTPASLLLAHARITAVGEDTSLAPFEQVVIKVRREWAVAWEGKVGREFHARLNLWRQFLEDYFSAPDQHYSFYPTEVRNRTMLSLLAKELRQLPPEMDLLILLDSKLRMSLIPTAFVWEPELESGFPHLEYWFLYGKLKPN